MSIEQDRMIVSPEQYFRSLRPCTDNDGVMCDLRTHVTIFVNNELNTAYTPLDMREWNAVKKWALLAGKSKKYTEQLNEYVWYDPVFLFQAEPLPGAREFSKWCYENDIGLPVVTTRRNSLRKSTINWYKEHMPWVPENDIHIQPTDGMPDVVFKPWVVNLFGYGAIFEDMPKHAKWVQDNTNARIFLVSNLYGAEIVNRGRLTHLRGNGRQVPNFLEFNKSLGIKS